MIRASLWAVAVIAAGAPSFARIRRKKPPRTERLRQRLWAAIRSAWETRCFTWRVFTDSTFPPEIRLSGQRPSQEAKCPPEGNADRWAPSSENRVKTVGAWNPGTCVRAVPRIRESSVRRSNRGGLPRGLRREGAAAGRGGAAGSIWDANAPSRAWTSASHSSISCWVCRYAASARTDQVADQELTT